MINYYKITKEELEKIGVSDATGKENIKVIIDVLARPYYEKSARDEIISGISRAIAELINLIEKWVEKQ